jgi:HAD superfamily hydrolase (TIGR01484 family)
MKPWQDFPTDGALAAHTVLTDIDDTLTTQGRLLPAAYEAMARLQQAGLRVIPVTGRPAGWCDMIARTWPVDGVMGENGAFYLWQDAVSRRLRSRHWSSDSDLSALAKRLAAVRDRVLQEVPGCGVASDQFSRWYDLAIDFCEDVPALPRSAVDRIVAIMQAEGMTAKVSSIHVNGWWGDWDKLRMARRMLAERHGVDWANEGARILFVGDSPNDAPMFGALPHSVGVANVADFLDRMEHPPTWVTRARSGAGFVEFAQHLLALRQA